MDDWASLGQEGPRPGDVIAGKYELVRQIGRGGMGSVFEARHLALGRSLAVKFLRADVADERDVIERFFREARVASALAHPRIVDVFDVGWTDDGLLPWFAMELLDGRSLAEDMSKAPQLPALRATAIISQVLDALEAAHARGIVHRDLKPENVFLIRHGIEDDVKVLDFGISKVMAKRITVTGVILGTPAYMSPEQVRGARDVDHRADIYSAGAILFEMLAGRPPFEGANYHQVLLGIMTGGRPTLQSLRPTLHPVLASATERAMAREPDQRWPTAAAMRDALVEVMDAVEELMTQGQESSLDMDVNTRAWMPSPRSAAFAAARAPSPKAPLVAPETTVPAEPSVEPERRSEQVREEVESPPTPLLAGVRPITGEPTVVRHSSVLMPALILGGLLLAAAAMVVFIFWQTP